MKNQIRFKSKCWNGFGKQFTRTLRYVVHVALLHMAFEMCGFLVGELSVLRTDFRYLGHRQFQYCTDSLISHTFIIDLEWCHLRRSTSWAPKIILNLTSTQRNIRIYYFQQIIYYYGSNYFKQLFGVVWIRDRKSNADCVWWLQKRVPKILFSMGSITIVLLIILNLNLH